MSDNLRLQKKRLIKNLQQYWFSYSISTRNSLKASPGYQEVYV